MGQSKSKCHLSQKRHFLFISFPLASLLHLSLGSSLGRSWRPLLFSFSVFFSSLYSDFPCLPDLLFSSHVFFSHDLPDPLYLAFPPFLFHLSLFHLSLFLSLLS